MKKSQIMNELKNAGIDWEVLKKSFGIKLKKGKSMIDQMLEQIIKKTSEHSLELMKIISPKNLIENHESKMIKTALKEKIYETIKDLSLINWKSKKAMLETNEEKLKAIKKALDYFLQDFIKIKKELCNEMINNWKKEEIKDNYYIS
ncbi:MAG: hypothetical protein PHG04_03105 [Candidatus Nanoarchaeia archaeon]|nr:hypothetical protein [Candidatus Nanoarchaeia archaeon]MDD5054341.1 hypothetical protein [Candidatus Nanoarchaeia archaeon]